MKIAFFDFETTGKNVETDRVTQLAVVIMDTETKKIISSYSETLYSEEYPPIHPEAAIVTKTDDAYIKRVGSLPYESFIILTAYFNRAEYIAGHNIKAFDLPILYAEMKRLHLPIDEIKNKIDTRFDIEYPKTIATRKLQYLAVEHDVQAKGAHSALFDVIMNAELFFKYDVTRTIELSASPEIWVRADVKYDDRQKAKDKKYMWDGSAKIWVRQIKRVFLEQEQTDSDFPILSLSETYKFPESTT